MTIELISAIFIVVVVLAALYIFHNEGYKKGQVDALSGKVKVSLIEFKDGRREWYYTREISDLCPDYKIIKPPTNEEISFNSADCN